MAPDEMNGFGFRILMSHYCRFKMRSNAFQTACMREVIRARDQVQVMEATMWEERERSELAIEHLASQLAATQVRDCCRLGMELDSSFLVL